MREFFSYLLNRIHFIALYLLSCTTVLVVMALSHMDMRIARYIVLLISTFFIMLMVFDCYRFLRRLHKLKRIIRAADELPAPQNDIERELLAQINTLSAELDECKNKLSRSKSDELEYYTLWVHQIKTPISAMRFVLSETDDERSNILLGELFKIEQYADLALRFVRLDSIDSNRVLDRCDLNKIASAAVKKYALLFIAKGLSISIGVLPDDVPCDEQWLTFILEQLISNAVKYTNKGGVTVRFFEGALEVIDSGIGIRAEDLPRIFEKGYTGYNGRLDSRASGIGLYLCKRAAGGLGIELKIESEPNKGTRARLFFPDRLWTE